MSKAVAILFANLKGNLGDFAILEAMIRNMSSRFPGKDIHIYSHSFLPRDETRCISFRVDLPSSLQFELKGTTYHRDLPKASRLLSPARLWRPFQNAMIHSVTKSATDAAEFGQYEAIFVAGGDQWSGATLGASMFGTLDAVARHCDRIETFPFSINPRLLRDHSKTQLRHSFGLIQSPLIVRDTISREVLDGLGLASELRPDCVFSLRSEGESVHPFESTGHKIILSLTGKKRALEAGLEACLERLMKAKVNVELLTTCDLEDHAPYDRVAERIGIQVRRPLTWREALAHFKSCNLLVSNRFHGLILGSFAGIPLLPVADRKKSLAFVRDVGLKVSAPSLQDLDANLVHRALAEGPEVVQAVATYLDQAERSGG